MLKFIREAKMYYLLVKELKKSSKLIIILNRKSMNLKAVSAIKVCKGILYSFERW